LRSSQLQRITWDAAGSFINQTSQTETAETLSHGSEREVHRDRFSEVSAK
jgi:hypothetical protein